MSMRTEGVGAPVDVAGVNGPEGAGRVPVEEGWRAVTTQERSWSEIVEATTRMLSRQSGAGVAQHKDTGSILTEMTTLLRLQNEVTRYQLRIELASKACESFTASLRKLQQQQ